MNCLRNILKYNTYATRQQVKESNHAKLCLVLEKKKGGRETIEWPIYKMMNETVARPIHHTTNVLLNQETPKLSLIFLQRAKAPLITSLNQIQQTYEV